MGKARIFQKMLLVEGAEDGYVFASFCNALFPQEGDQKSVWVHEMGSDRELLNKDALQAFMRQPKIQRLGIIVDGDQMDGASSPKDRWSNMRDLLREEGYRDVPESFPRSGVTLPPVQKEAANIRPSFAMWIMPDNVSPGYCETLLWMAIEDLDNRFPGKHQLESHLRSLELGGPLRKFAEIRFHKAALRTWLTWSSEPDLKTGDAVARFFATHDLEVLRDFKSWLARAYEDAP